MTRSYVTKSRKVRGIFQELERNNGQVKLKNLDPHTSKTLRAIERCAKRNPGVNFDMLYDRCKREGVVKCSPPPKVRKRCILFG